MQALLRGERTASVGVAAGLLGVVCLLVASLGLNIKHADDLDGLRATILKRCQQRLTYDTRFVRAAEGDAEFYADLLTIADRAAKVRTTPLTAAQQQLVDEQRRMLEQARDRKRAIVAEGVIGNCDAYRK